MPLLLRYFDLSVVTLVVVFFELCDFFGLIFWFFVLFFLLSLRVSSSYGDGDRIMYIFISSPPFKIDHTLSWVYFDWCFVLITVITHKRFFVPCKLLSSFVPLYCCFFFLRVIPSTCGFRFCQPYGTILLN